MTKRSEKGTNITTRSGLTRDAHASVWFSDVTPDSAKDNPISIKIIQDVIAANIKAVIDGGLLTIPDSANDVVAFAPSSIVSVAGSVYTVDSVFYIYVSGNIFKVNTGSATLTDTIRLIVSSTEDGLFQTADIDDGASFPSFIGTSPGNFITDLSDIFWLNDSFNIEEDGNITIKGGQPNLNINGTDVTTIGGFLKNNKLNFQNKGTTQAWIGYDVSNPTTALNLNSISFQFWTGATRAKNVTITEDITIHNGGLSSGGDVLPITDGSHDVGGASFRWSDIYATNGTIQTSDGRLKEDIKDSDLGLEFILEQRPVSFKRKGGKRTHYGLIAQEVEDSLKGKDFAGLVKAPVDDDFRYGLRDSEFIAPMIKAIKEQNEMIKELKAEINKLKK